MAPKPTQPETPKKTRSVGVAAGALYERIKKINAEEDEEKRDAPASITARHAKRRQAALASADPVVAALAAKMLAEDSEPGAG
jgi:hypothetical protein